jgi:chromosome segregation protein
MFLEKLEVQGFKSFASKNVLIFPGMLDHDQRGITAIVGPNGSGKSNVADSVRWALGEQSMKTLRGKKSEDVIFSGSDKKGKLGMAEVSLHLNNEDRQAPVDYSQIVITRRLYRSGESEYLLNNSRVRLSDIQMLLAKAKFGQKTYSVIGQGMVEGFLNTSLAERKEFFDEATGVKQYQIKRDDSLNKLLGSYENLAQANMLIAEIDPRLKSLTRQVNKLKRRGEIEDELKIEQLDYYAKLWHEINSQFREHNEKYLRLEKDKFAKEKKIEGVALELEKFRKEISADNKFEAKQNELHGKQSLRDEINKKLARLETQLEIKIEATGQFDLSFLVNRRDEIEREQAKLAEEIKVLETSVRAEEEKGEGLLAEKNKIDQETKKINTDLEKESEKKDDHENQELSRRLKKALAKIQTFEEEHDIASLKSLAKEIAKEIEEIIRLYEKAEDKTEAQSGANWQKLQNLLNNLMQAKEEVMLKINEVNLSVSIKTAKLKLLQEKNDDLESEHDNLKIKIKQKSENFDFKELEEEKDKIKKQLVSIDGEISFIRSEISETNEQEETRRNRLFSLQNDLQNLQYELNILSNQLNDIKVSSTRYETKLEDLEVEIRDELGSLKEVKEKTPADFDVDAKKERIGQLKRQLEQIGGIDSQVEKEYEETKERFDFLTNQVDDLTKAIASLEEVIKELDIIIKEQFDKEYKEIANNFEKYFKILFNGGSAKIIKVMADEKEDEEPSVTEISEDNLEEAPKKKEENQMSAELKKIKFLQKHNATGLAGIEIQATPPGKKIKSISMLSGGERALTAIALICAIINSNPSPFVVLDEVDAALDEANSERLAKILDELSHRTQFIVITHNRASMRRANILYGVTMGDDGVSKLLSIKLEEAKTN